MAERDISTANKNASQGRVTRPVWFVRLGYDGGDVLLNSTDRTLSFDHDDDTNDEDFLGVGKLGKITGPEETLEVRAVTIDMELSGIDPSDIAVALDEDYSGRPVEVWLGFVDENYALVADPFLISLYNIDTQSIELGETATIQVSATQFAAWERAKTDRYTNADQQELYSGDVGLEFVAQQVEKELVWGVTVGPA